MTALNVIMAKPAPFRTKSLLATRMLVMSAKRYKGEGKRYKGEGREMYYRHLENIKKY